MSEYKYIRNDIKDEYGVLRLQDKILEIMSYIDEFCKENNISYYLMGGSALGAIRHGGFIPWDDDLDIFMDWENYQKFIDCCKKSLDTERFYLQIEDTNEHPHFFLKLKRNGTTFIEEFGSKKGKKHQGIFVDIMCLNNAAKSDIGKKVQYYSAGLLKAKALTRTTYKTDNTKKKIQLFVAKCVVWGPIKKILLYTVRKYNKKATQEVAHLFGRAKYSNSFYPRNCFEEAVYVPFEKTEFAVPCGYNEYLTIRYGGNYMKMPDEKTKAMYASHAVKWDVEK